MNKVQELEKLKKISNLANIHFVWQKEMNGLGDAIRYARDHVGNEPFSVLLGDTLISGNGKPITRQLIEVYERYKGSVVALEQVPWEKVHRYGIINGKPIAGEDAAGWDLQSQPLNPGASIPHKNRIVYPQGRKDPALNNPDYKSGLAR